MTTDNDDRSRPDPAQGPEVDLHKFDKLVKGERTCMFITVDADGSIHGRPMTVQSREGNTLWFMAYADSPKLDQLATHAQVNLSFVDGDSWVSTSGRGVVVDDVAKKKELWNKFAEAWFQKEPEDPAVALIRVDLSGGEYWDSPSKPVQAFNLAKMFATGARPDDGDNAKLDLG